jgi:hypothetical protein
MTASIVATTNTTALVATTITGNKPTGTADGDVMFAFAAASTGTAPTAPAGWTVCAIGAQKGIPATLSAWSAGAPAGGSAWYYKVAASEGTTYQWTGFAAASSISLTIITTRGLSAQLLGGVFSTVFAFEASRANSRVSTTIAMTAIALPSEFTADAHVIVAGFVQNVAATTTNLSALSASMTSQANHALPGVSVIVGTEITDATTNPDYGTRQCTTDTGSGTGRGYVLFIASPSVQPTDNPNKPPRGYHRR